MGSYEDNIRLKAHKKDLYIHVVLWIPQKIVNAKRCKNQSTVFVCYCLFL